MALQNFVDKVGPVISAAWLNQIDSYLVGPATAPLAQTAIESGLGITPVNKVYGEGVVDRYAINTTPGTTDMTLAIQKAVSVHVAGGAPVQFLPAVYLATDTAISITSTQHRIVIRGVPFRSTILNKAGASKPTIKLAGAQYVDIRGLVLIGAAGFPNNGLQMVLGAAAARCGFNYFEDLVFQTNGGGVLIQDTNSCWFRNCSYWPSGGSSFGGTLDSNGQPYFILANGTAAVNSIHLQNINVSGLNTIAADATAAAVKIDGSASAAAFQDWVIISMESELVGSRALWIRNGNSITVANLFHENAEVRIDNNTIRCSFIDLSAAASGTIVLDGTTSPCRQLAFIGCQAKNVQGDSANSENFYLNCSFPVAPGFADSATKTSRINVETTGSVLIADGIGMSSTLGFVERDRTVAVGAWTTPAFSAGDYTASSGSWTLQSGDVSNLQYMLVGKTLFINGVLDTTTVTATPASLVRTIPGGFTSAKAFQTTFLYTEDAGTTTKTGILTCGAGVSTIQFQKDFAATTWATTTNLTYLRFSIAIEVQ